MATAFLGKGWAFPIRYVPSPDNPQSGDIAMAEYDRDGAQISQSIWIILSTARGERVMRPDFGCGIHDYVFALNNATTIGLISQEVRQALLLWEPRIDVQDVQVTTAPDNAATLLIAVSFTVRATNSAYNLVYPFFLNGSTA